jgi:hypothetical protein
MHGDPPDTAFTEVHYQQALAVVTAGCLSYSFCTV